MSAQAGIFYFDRRPVPPDVLDRLCPRNETAGPHRSGRYVSDGIALLSFALHFDSWAARERQPIVLSDESVTTWDGRLDNRDDFLVSLNGDLADDRTDATLVASALARWGDAALSRILGDWSVVRWDSRARQLRLARDYAGVRPLYYCHRPDYVVWSTSVETLAEFCEVRDELSEPYIARYITGTPLEDHTKYPGIFLVPYRASMRIDADGLARSGEFFTFEPRSIRYRRTAEYEDHYRQALTDAIRVRLRSSSPVWAELSGGYDSASIVCVANQLVRGGAAAAPAIRPVSVVPPIASPESDETRYIEAVEKFCGLQSARVEAVGVSQDGQQVATERGAGFTSGPPVKAGDYLLLSGEGGDLITMSVGRTEALVDHIKALRLKAFLSDTVTNCRLTRSPVWTAWRELLRLPVGARRSERRRNEGRVTDLAAVRRLPANDVARLYGLRREFLAAALKPSRAIAASLGRMPREKWHLLFGLHDFCAGQSFLRQADEALPALMSYPFLDRPLVEFILAVPPSILWRPAHSRGFVCGALRDALPEEVLRRNHKGDAGAAVGRFVAPAVMDLVARLAQSELVTRGYADRTVLERLLRDVLDNSLSAQLLVMRLLATEALLRRSRTGRRAPRDEPWQSSSMQATSAAGT